MTKFAKTWKKHISCYKNNLAYFNFSSGKKNEKNRGFFRCPHDIQCINAKRVKRDIYEVGRKKN
jgi:hypothetical protein